MRNQVLNDDIANRLIKAMYEAGHATLNDIGEILANATRADIPIGDPGEDPDPSYSLRSNVYVRVYGKYVSVSVEGAYAVKQHEAMHFHHPRGGRSKFLEANVLRLAQVWEGMLAGSVQKTFAGTRGRAPVQTNYHF